METNRFKMLAAAITAGTLGIPFPANASPVETITNGDFTAGLTGWTTTGTVNVRPSTDAINTSTTAGFGGFFGGHFAVLGDASGVVGGTPSSGVSTLSQSVTFSSPQSEVVISFDWALDTQHVLERETNILLIKFGTNTIMSQGFATPDEHDRLATGHTTVSFENVDPGSYRLLFQLSENGEGTNSAVGIGRVSVLDPPSSVPVPGTLALLGLGLAGLGFSRRKGVQT